MLNFNISSKLESYAARQLHLMLEIYFSDDVDMLFMKKNNISGLKIKLKDQEDISIETNFLELCSHFLTLRRESTLPKDSLGRVNFSKEQADEISSPLLDNEVIKLRILVEEFLCSNDVNYSKLSFIDEPSVCLSHDVDSLKSNSIFRFLYNIFKSTINLNFSSLHNFLKKRSTYVNTHGDLKRFVEIEDKFSFRSTYFFLSLPFFLGREGRRYTVNSRKIRKHMRFLIDNKFELGMHMSRKGFSKIKLGKREIERLEKASGGVSVTGVRNHYLKGDFPKIWNLYENLFEYDSSLGSSEYIVYRSGTSNPFQPFDYNLNRELEILEVPLIVMDGAITGNCEEIFNQVKKHVDIAFKNKSLITILWHTDRILPDEFTEYSRAYEKILDYLFQLDFSSITINEAAIRYKDYKQRMEGNLNLSL